MYHLSVSGLLITVLTLLASVCWLYSLRLRKIFRFFRRRDFLPWPVPEGRKSPLLTAVMTAGSLFPFLLALSLIRGFITDVYRVDGSSMLPSLGDGDVITVTKHAYGLRDPLFNTVIYSTGTPQRGDMIVFRSPENPGRFSVRRVAGIPGDTVFYTDKQIYIERDGEPVPVPVRHMGSSVCQGRHYAFFEEVLGHSVHLMLIDPLKRDEPELWFVSVNAETLSAEPRGSWTVPDGMYFVIGDNRDHSTDSRHLGFVPFSHILGRAESVIFPPGKDD